MNQGSPTIRLRDGTKERLKKAFGVDSDVAVAERIGIDQSQYSRVTRGHSSPGPYFQARLLLAADVNGLGFYDLFEIVGTDSKRDTP